jgi:hypothetical protein
VDDPVAALLAELEPEERHYVLNIPGWLFRTPLDGTADASDGMGCVAYFDVYSRPRVGAASSSAGSGSTIGAAAADAVPFHPLLPAQMEFELHGGTVATELSR